MNKHSIKHYLSILLIITFTQAYSLTIESKGTHVKLSSSKLLTTYPIDHIKMSNNRAYPNQSMTYTAIKLCDLLKPFQIKSTDMLEFIASDKFFVLIPAKKVMTCNKNSAIGYLAIEPPEKWPLLKNGTRTTAGPYGIIWVHPERSYISNEYWAWSVIKIVVHQTLDPKIFMTPPITQDAHIKKGFEVYVSHCAGCHSINKIGKGTIGPDLNIPKNPTEYYSNDATLKQFIRDPQSVRVIKNDRMSGSKEDFLSNADLDDLIRYFHYMAKHKQ